MRKLVLALLLCPTLICKAQDRKPGPVKDAVLLPNGWSLSPAGRSINLGDLPLNMAVSASRKLIAVTNNGQSTQSIQLIDAQAEKLLDEVVIPKSWYGLKFSNNDHYLYASGGNDNWILRYTINNNKLTLSDTIKLGKKWPVKISPAGLDIDESKQILYVVSRENNKLYLVNLKTKIITDTLSMN